MLLHIWIMGNIYKDLIISQVVIYKNRNLFKTGKALRHNKEQSLHLKRIKKVRLKIGKTIVIKTITEELRNGMAAIPKTSLSHSYPLSPSNQAKITTFDKGKTLL